MVKLSVENLKKSFEKHTVLEDINFSVQQGEFLSILGPSGCGKTTLLRILIGIEDGDEGIIWKDGVDITRKTPVERGMGIVFQNYALFPNMTVLQNVMYALRFHPQYKSHAKATAMKILGKIDLMEQIGHKPHQLSGGQQQRVAIARTLALNPDIILFDEPMSALDAANRLLLRKEIKKIQSKFDITMIFITHDQEEAFAMSDRVMVMRNASIEQIGTPKEVYQEPINDYVHEFVTQHLQEKVSSILESTGEKG